MGSGWLDRMACAAKRTAANYTSIISGTATGADSRCHCGVRYGGLGDLGILDRNRHPVHGCSCPGPAQCIHQSRRPATWWANVLGNSGAGPSSRATWEIHPSHCEALSSAVLGVADPAGVPRPVRRSLLAHLCHQSKARGQAQTLAASSTGAGTRSSAHCARCTGSSGSRHRIIWAQAQDLLLSVSEINSIVHAAHGTLRCFYGGRTLQGNPTLRKAPMHG